MPRLARDVAEIARRAWFTGPTGYVFDGHERELDVDVSDVAELAPIVGPDGGKPPALFEAMAGELYGAAYTRAQRNVYRVQSDYQARRRFLAELSAANHGNGTWEPGWVVQSRDTDGRWAVRKDALTLYVRDEEAKVRDGAEMAVGARVRIRMSKEIRELMPGFYMVIGDGDDDDQEDDTLPLVRLYWSLNREAAVPYIDAITSCLNPTGIPYRTKVLSEPAAYGRADGGVLYIGRRHIAQAWPVIREVHGRIASKLRPAVPMFTKRMGKGLGLAEDPGNGESFGQNRCRVLVEGLWQAHAHGGETEDARRVALAESFRRWRLSAIQPYLRTARRESYGWLDQERAP